MTEHPWDETETHLRMLTAATMTCEDLEKTRQERIQEGAQLQFDDNEFFNNLQERMYVRRKQRQEVLLAEIVRGLNKLPVPIPMYEVGKRLEEMARRNYSEGFEDMITGSAETPLQDVGTFVAEGSELVIKRKLEEWLSRIKLGDMGYLLGKPCES